VINAQSTIINAYYISAPDEIPGKMRLEAKNSEDVTFTVQVNDAVPWFPAGLTTAANSTNDEWVNGLFFSKPLQPEAVPIGNFFRVGNPAAPILRIKALQDTLFVIKDDGIFTVIGDDANNFRVDLLDNSAKIIAPESIVVLNNKIYALSDQGVITISPTGVQMVSRPIETTLTQLRGESPTQVETLGFGVSYESERKYLLWLPIGSADTYARQCFVYNTITKC
jgi:hypothetical protein